MISGFLQVWAPAMKGNLITLSPDSVHVGATGYTIERQTGSQFDRVTMDKQYLVKRIVSRNSAITAEEDASFTGSPDGLLLTRLDDTYH